MAKRAKKRRAWTAAELRDLKGMARKKTPAGRIAKKLRRWLLIARYDFVDPSCPPARARKNYQRLCTRYPQIMQKLGLNEFSAF